MRWSAVLTVVAATAALPAPYAAIVIDADTGEVIHSKNGESIMHPTGLTGLGNLSGSPWPEYFSDTYGKSELALRFLICRDQKLKTVK